MLLRPYQDQSIESLREGFRLGHKRQVLAAPTGAGKSVMMVDIIQKAIAKESRCMFVCERRNLVEQFSVHLDRQGIDHGILMADHWRYRPGAYVQVASCQTLERMDSYPIVDFIFLDELHVLMRKSIVQMLEARPNLKTIGATATPFNPLIGKYFTNVVSPITMKELVDQGNLVPFRVFVAHEVDTKGLKVVAGEWQKDQLEQRGQQIVGDIVSDYVKLSHDIHGGFKKTICFSCGIAHGAELVQNFQEVGVNAIQLASGVDDDYKTQVLEEFAKPDSGIDMLISVDMLARGYDQTDIEHVILARPLKKSFSQHVQMVGRGARSHDGKKFCVVQDHSGNWVRFLDDWNKLYNEGVTTLTGEEDKKSRKEPSDEQKEAAKCPKCGCIRVSDTCPHCGYVWIKKNQAITIAGEMTELSGSVKIEKYDSSTKERWFHELLGYARTKGMKDGWAWHKYKEKFGINPPWKKETKPISEDVQGWITHLNIKRSYSGNIFK